MRKVFKFYSDPGHGWIAVKRQLLTELGIADKISSYSYQRGKTVYLEEDCDAPTFVNAFKNTYGGNNIGFQESYAEKTPIRSYDSYKKD